MSWDEIRAKLGESMREAYPTVPDDAIELALATLDANKQQVDKELAEKEAGYCTVCSHSFTYHDQEMIGAGSVLIPEANPNHYEDLYQCSFYEGMGNWCGCEVRSRQPAVPKSMSSRGGLDA